MDWKLAATTFAAVFAAEIADKTQLVGIGLAAESQKPVSVFLGSVAGYAAVTLLSVWAGAAAAKYLRPEWLKWGGATLFIAIGVWMLFERS